MNAPVSPVDIDHDVPRKLVLEIAPFGEQGSQAVAGKARGIVAAVVAEREPLEPYESRVLGEKRILDPAGSVLFAELDG
jgi:hypothetical protein